jgi:hypothetical protein
LANALTGGRFGLDLRYRLEWVDDADFDDDGEASTLRTVLRYTSAPWHHVAAMVELENVTDVGFANGHSNGGSGDLSNGVTDRPVVADPALTEVNQAYLDFGFLPDTSVKVGRQEIVLANQRFVGSVAWRQNHQTFDAASVTTRAVPRTLFTYAYVGKVQRIFGDTHDMSSHLLEADVTTGSVGTLSGYAFLLDYDNEAQAGLSTGTYGLRFAGGHALGSRLKALWDLELAEQRDLGDNPSEVDAGYWRAVVGGSVGSFKLTLGREVLEGDPANGRFTTPLATLHAWNGWADQFLTTPDNGLEDTLVTVGATLGGVRLTGVYHVFEANTGGADYGSELDLQAVFVTPWKQEVGLKVAAYDADRHSRDVTKAMLWTAWGF